MNDDFTVDIETVTVPKHSVTGFREMGDVEGEVSFDIPFWVSRDEFLRQLNSDDFSNPISGIISCKFIKFKDNLYFNDSFPTFSYLEDGVVNAHSLPKLGIYEIEWFTPYGKASELHYPYFFPTIKESSKEFVEGGLIFKSEVEPYSPDCSTTVVFAPTDIHNDIWQDKAIKRSLISYALEDATDIESLRIWLDEEFEFEKENEVRYYLGTDNSEYLFIFERHID